MSIDERRIALADFTRFARSLKGDEKSEAQLFLDHFFRALGHGGVQEAGATLEFRIAKKPGSAQLTLEEPGVNPLRDAHTRLDTAVRAAYAMPKDADALTFLLALNIELAAKKRAGEPITAPGLPLPSLRRRRFVTDDCVVVSAVDSAAKTRLL